ncbi:MAG: glycosyltransferase family 4 protein [Planctomycetes bacterium]|nr:glycosyltransferase family 4 protein [Planctomycetota bacterium]
MTRPIVFDGGVLAEPTVTGVGRSLLATLEAYAPLTDRPLVLLLPDDADDPRLDGVEVRRGFRGALARTRRAPGIARELDAALWHSPVAALPWYTPCPRVATIHDLPWMADPRVPGDESDRRRHRLAVRHAARRADGIVCASRATRRQLVRFLRRRPRGLVRVVHPGTSEATKASQVDRGPVLVIAADRPRKNLERVRHAHRIARERDDRVGPLEILGPPNRYVSEAEKSERLSGAAALLHFSLFEGFGMPVVEAFRHEVPVACSARGGLAEVAGDAACLAEPESVDEMADAIVRVCTDASLRAVLRERGRERAARFTAEAAARGWLRLHRELIG